MDELIERLHAGGYSCVIRNGEIRTFTQRGVLDLFALAEKDPAFLQGAQVADKVIGKGAAALLVQGGIREVYADVISRPARELLQAAGIQIRCAQQVEYIRNRAGTGRCPLETLCEGQDKAEDLLPLIRGFVEKMRT